MTEFRYMPSRYLCDVLEEMRKMYETRNFSGLLGSIEQAQSMANRMEAALGDKRTLESYEDDASKARGDLRKVQADIKKANRELEIINRDKNEAEDKLKSFRSQYNKESKGGTLDKPVPLSVSKPKECSECGVIGCGLDCMK